METTADSAADLATDAPTTPATAGSTFLVALEVCLWSVYTIGFIMVMVVVMMQ